MERAFDRERALIRKRPAGRRAADAASKRDQARAAAGDVRIYPNDPDATVGLVPATPVALEPGLPAFVIEGRRYAPADYAPGTLAFQYWQGEIALERVIRVWEDLFDRDFASWHGGKPLKVKLRAGRDLNAFYDRKSLQFFFDKDSTSGRTVYASESLDVVTHEAGHAILDIYQPGYWSSVDLETASFHEAFADCSALLTTLTDVAVRRQFLVERVGAGRKSNLVSRLAEALGRAIYDNYGPSAVGDPTRLRDANNSFRYAKPDTLPAGAADDAVAGEPHSFSRVFTGAFYDLLVWLLAREAKNDPSEAGVERARRLAGRLLGRAIETLPPGEARYLAVAFRMREIDQTEEGGVASIGIEQAFAAHGMKLPALTRVKAGMRGRAEPARALRALDPDRPGGATAMNAALGLPGHTRLKRSTLPGRLGSGVREQFIHRDWIRVRHPAFRRRDGVLVRVLCGCTLTRGPSGDVEQATIAPHPHPTAAEMTRRVRRWLAMGAIDVGRDGAQTSRAHFKARTPFRVGRGGVLERVYFE